MKTETEEYKFFQVRLKRSHWLFLKKLSLTTEKSMNQIITRMIERKEKSYNKSVDKQNNSDTIVS